MLDRSETSTKARLPPHDRRLFSLVLRAFYQAYDQSSIEVTTCLLGVLTHLLSSSAKSNRADRRRSERDLIEVRELHAKLAGRSHVIGGEIDAAGCATAANLAAHTLPCTLSR